MEPPLSCGNSDSAVPAQLPCHTGPCSHHVHLPQVHVLRVGLTAFDHSGGFSTLSFFTATHLRMPVVESILERFYASLTDHLFKSCRQIGPKLSPQAICTKTLKLTFNKQNFYLKTCQLSNVRAGPPQFISCHFSPNHFGRTSLTSFDRPGT